MKVQADDYWGWKHRMKITLAGYIPPNGPETLTNFPVLVVFNTNISEFSYTEFKSAAGGDLRFQDSSETSALNFEIEHWNTNGSSFVWVQLPILSSSSDYFWAYWGNANTNLPPATIS